MNGPSIKAIGSLTIVAVLVLVTASCAPLPAQPATQQQPTKQATSSQATAPSGIPAETLQVLKNWIGEKELPGAAPVWRNSERCLCPDGYGLGREAPESQHSKRNLQYYYETLFDRDYAGKLKPLLVKEEQVSPDGLIVTWKLQSGVKFCDGTPFNAEAVKWNLNRKIETKEFYYELLGAIKSMDVVDDLTLKLTLNPS